LVINYLNQATCFMGAVLGSGS